MNEIAKQALIKLAEDKLDSMKISEELAKAFANSYAQEAQHYYEEVYQYVGNQLESTEPKRHLALVK